MYGYKSWSVGKKKEHCLKLIQMRYSFDVILRGCQASDYFLSLAHTQHIIDRQRIHAKQFLFMF